MPHFFLMVTSVCGSGCGDDGGGSSGSGGAGGGNGEMQYGKGNSETLGGPWTRNSEGPPNQWYFVSSFCLWAPWTLRAPRTFFTLSTCLPRPCQETQRRAEVI